MKMTKLHARRPENVMKVDGWKEMNDLEKAFSQVTTVEFLLEKLQEAVDKQDNLATVNISHALNSYITVFISNYDEAFQEAWRKTIGNPQTFLQDNE